MDLDDYLRSRIASAPSGDRPLRRIDEFRRQFGRTHLVFACHAALPIGLTPHLLNMLQLNFQRDECNTPLNIPWVATADLLLSSLCQRVGGRLYEMYHAVRQELLAALEQDTCFGSYRRFHLAKFVRAYVRPQLERDDPYWRPIAQAQDWNALAYIDPKEAAASLAKELGQSIAQGNYAEQLRLATILETLAVPLQKYAGLVTYARLRRGLVQGQAPTTQETAFASQELYASQKLKVVALPTAGGQLVIPGLENVTLPPLEQKLPVEDAVARLETLLTRARQAFRQRDFALAGEYAHSALKLDPGSTLALQMRDLATDLPLRLQALEGSIKLGNFPAYQQQLDQIQALLEQLEPDPQTAQALLENLLSDLSSDQAAPTPAPTAPAPAPPPRSGTSQRLNKDDWAIVIGINQYPNIYGLPPLQGAVNDARRFITWLTSPNGGAVPLSHIGKFLQDTSTSAGMLKPTELDIRRFIQDRFLTKVKKKIPIGRRLYLYFSGHGISPTGQEAIRNSALLMANAIFPKQLFHIPGNILAEGMRSSAYFHEVVLIMDCSRDLVEPVAPNDFEYFSPNEISKICILLEAYATKWASKARELPLPPNNTMQGIFTHSLLEVLGAGKMSGTMLKQSVKEHLARLLQDEKRAQEPEIGPDAYLDKFIFNEAANPPRTPVTIKGHPPTLPVIEFFPPGADTAQQEALADWSFNGSDWSGTLEPRVYELRKPAGGGKRLNIFAAVPEEVQL